jgi:hypothetical protein
MQRANALGVHHPQQTVVQIVGRPAICSKSQQNFSFRLKSGSRSILAQSTRIQPYELGNFRIMITATQRSAFVDGA